MNESQAKRLIKESVDKSDSKWRKDLETMEQDLRFYFAFARAFKEPVTAYSRSWPEHKSSSNKE